MIGQPVLQHQRLHLLHVLVEDDLGGRQFEEAKQLLSEWTTELLLVPVFVALSMSDVELVTLATQAAGSKLLLDVRKETLLKAPPVSVVPLAQFSLL